MANDSFKSISSFPPPSADQFSISPEEDQVDDVIDPVTNDKNGLRQEKINKLVSEGAKNYPAYLKLIYTAYLKLIYTGESELSSEDETHENRPARLKTNRMTSLTGSSHSRQPLPFTASRAHNVCASDIVATSRGRSTILSPESNKLLDPGREKIATPTESQDVCSSITSPTTEYFRSVGVLSPTSDAIRVTNVRDPAELELLKIQDDIFTLRGMLEAKLQIAADLKRKLGITPFTELKQSVRHFKDTDTYQKTNAVFKHFGVFATKKMANFRQKKAGAQKSNEEPDMYSNDLSSQDGHQLMSSKSETNVADYSNSGRNPRR